jgi:hypothetical protein
MQIADIKMICNLKGKAVAVNQLSTTSNQGQGFYKNSKSNVIHHHALMNSPLLVKSIVIIRIKELAESKSLTQICLLLIHQMPKSGP